MSDDQVPEPLSRSATEYLDFEDNGQHPNSGTSESTTRISSKETPLSGSKFFTTSTGMELLDLIDSLRSINNVTSAIPLPQIAVIGQQSCGKSSILNAITGIKFPVNEGMTTRFPTEIKLRRTNHHWMTVSFRDSIDPDPAKQMALDRFADEWKSKSVTLLQLPEIIASAGTALGLNNTSRFSDEVLVLEVCGPEQENLTLIDLPGFFVSPGPGQTQADIDFVETMVHKQMEDPWTILLSVFSGATDFENQILMRKLSNTKRYRERAFGIITAPDKTKSDTQATKYLAYARNEHLELKHGWHILRNLDAAEEAKKYIRHKVEKEFFESESPWCDFDKNRVGSQALIHRLSQILQFNIEQGLSSLEYEVEKAIKDCETQLQALGGERLTLTQQRKYLRDRGREFGKTLKNTLEGKLQLGELDNEGMSLRALISQKGREFYDEMDARGKSWTLVSDAKNVYTPAQKHTLIAEIFQGKYPNTMELCEADVLCWLSQTINKKKGPELPNLVDPTWASLIFRCQSKRWRSMAQEYLHEVFDVVQERVVTCVMENFDTQVSSRILQTLILPRMRERKSQVDNKLEELCKPYFDRHIQTLSLRLYKLLRTQPSKAGTSSLLDGDRGVISAGKCRQMLETVDAVYEIFIDTFIDNIQNLAVESCLLEDLHTLADDEQFDELDDISVGELAGEPPENKAKREKLKRDQERYIKAKYKIASISSVAAINLNGDRPSKPVKVSNQDSSESPGRLDNLKAPSLAGSYDHHLTERKEIRQGSELSPPKLDPAISASPVVDVALHTLYQPVRHRATPQVTPKKMRRHRQVSESPDLPRTSYIADDGFSSPSTIRSSSSNGDTTSSMSSYRNSPQPPAKAGIVEFNTPQRVMTDSSEV